MPVSGELRKDEPHPVSLLPAAAQFVEHPRIDRRLGFKEALEVEGVTVPTLPYQPADQETVVGCREFLRGLRAGRTTPRGRSLVRLHPPAFRGPFDFKPVALNGIGFDVSFNGERGHPFASALPDIP